MGRDDALTAAGRLEDRVAEFARTLAGIRRCGRLASSLVARGTLPGEFLALQAVGRGLEPDVPRTFAPDDDPGSLDLGRLGAAGAENPAWALLNGELRSIPAVPVSEAELIAVIDLSRSMLSGSLAEPAGRSAPAPAKLEALFFAAAAFLTLAEAARFGLRAAYVHGGRVAEDRARTPHGFAHRALAVMGRRLVQTFRAVEQDPAAVEPFGLGAGLAAALAVRTRGVVVVLSDFLDPLLAADGAPGYARVLVELLARHQVILVDLAAPADLEFPLPGRLDLEAQRVPCREGARHPELGTEGRCLTREAIRDWNARRRDERARLRRLVAAGGGRWARFWGLGYPQCHARALMLLKHLRR